MKTVVTTINTVRRYGSRLNLPAPDKAYKPIIAMKAPRNTQSNANKAGLSA